MFQLIAKYIALISERFFFLFVFNMFYKNLPTGKTASEQTYRVISKYTVF